jgi:hypothetical protein
MALSDIVPVLDLDERWRTRISKNHYIRAATHDRRENYGVNPLRAQIITDFLGRSKVIWVKCGLKRFFQD